MVIISELVESWAPRYRRIFCKIVEYLSNAGEPQNIQEVRRKVGSKITRPELSHRIYKLEHANIVVEISDRTYIAGYRVKEFLEACKNLREVEKYGLIQREILLHRSG